MKTKFKIFLCFIFLIYTSLSLFLCSFANEINYKDKLIVIYKTSPSSNEITITPSFNPTPKYGSLPFESILNKAIEKIQNSTNTSKLPINFLFREINIDNQNQNAQLETKLEKLDTYIVKVTEPSIIDSLISELKKEQGVINVTRDFEVQIPNENFFENNFTSQSCNVTPSCATGKLTCSQGVPACPLGKRPVCVFLTGKEPFAACLGDRKITREDISCSTSSFPLPNDPYNAENWHYEKTGLPKAWQGTCSCPLPINPINCNVKEYPEYCMVGNPNVVIAVLDNGFSIGAQVNTIGHPDLINRSEINLNRNVIFGDNPFDYDSSDEPSSEVFYDHGTASAISAIGSSNNNSSHAGVNWKSPLWAIRIGKGRSASLSDILNGFNYVVNKVKEVGIQHFLVNLSYGTSDCNKSLAKAVDDFVGITVKNTGGLITISSGNDACKQDFEDIAPNILVVGATNGSSPCSNEEVASYSNYGSITDIFSPSGFIVDNRNTGVQNYSLNKQKINGTSFAAPSLAGFASLLWSSNPNLTPDEVEKILKVSSFNSLSLFDNNETSKNKINLSQSAQVKIDDAINLQSQILQLVILTDPVGENLDLYVDEKNEVKINAFLLNSIEELKLEAINLPSGAIFDNTSGFGNITQIFSWTPTTSEINNKYTVTFFVKNSQNKVIGYKKIIFNVIQKNENKPPVSDAGPDQTIFESTSVILDGSKSYDPEGKEISFDWFQIDNGAPIVDLLNPDKSNPTFIAPEVKEEIILSFILTVFDELGNEASDIVNITVQNKNKSPIANAGPDRFVVRNRYVRIGSSLNKDPDGDLLKFFWTQINGPKVTLINPTSQYPIFRTPFSLTTPGNEIIFRLTVDDGYGGIASDEVSVFVVR